eukprot:5587994-Prymnesium_polylepis.2
MLRSSGLGQVGGMISVPRTGHSGVWSASDGGARVRRGARPHPVRLCALSPAGVAHRTDPCDPDCA